MPETDNSAQILQIWQELDFLSQNEEAFRKSVENDGLTPEQVDDEWKSLSLSFEYMRKLQNQPNDTDSTTVMPGPIPQLSFHE